MKIAPGHWIFPIELIKLPISYVKRFSKMSGSKKIDKILKIAFHKTILYQTLNKYIQAENKIRNDKNSKDFLLNTKQVFLCQNLEKILWRI